MDDTSSPGSLGLPTRLSRLVYRRAIEEERETPRDLLARVLDRASAPV